MTVEYSTLPYNYDNDLSISQQCKRCTFTHTPCDAWQLQLSSRVLHRSPHVGRCTVAPPEICTIRATPFLLLHRAPTVPSTKGMSVPPRAAASLSHTQLLERGVLTSGCTPPVYSTGTPFESITGEGTMESEVMKACDISCSGRSDRRPPGD